MTIEIKLLLVEVLIPMFLLSHIPPDRCLVQPLSYLHKVLGRY